MLTKVVKEALRYLKVECLVLEEVRELTVLFLGVVAVKVDHVASAGYFWHLPQDLQLGFRDYLLE